MGLNIWIPFMTKFMSVLLKALPPDTSTVVELLATSQALQECVTTFVPIDQPLPQKP